MSTFVHVVHVSCKYMPRYNLIHAMAYMFVQKHVKMAIVRKKQYILDSYSEIIAR